MAATRPIAIIAGVGPSTGAALARKFGAAYPVALLARTPDSVSGLVREINQSGGRAVGVRADVSDQESMKAAMAQVRKEFGEEVTVAAAIFNASGGFVRKPFLEVPLEDFTKGWSVTVQGGVLFSKATLPLLLAGLKHKPEYAPTLIFTGATASVKANALISTFNTAKFALRALSSSLAKEFGPQGVHVGHAIIDGPINTPFVKEWIKDPAPDSLISPEGIADAYWHLHTQPRSAFTWEIDIRPYVEKW